MRRDFAACDAELRLRLANRTDITEVMRNNFLNDGLLDVAIMFQHPQLQAFPVVETLLAGEDAINPSTADIWVPTLLRNETDGYIIRQDSQQRIERAQVKPVAPPYTYYWYNSRFHFESRPLSDKQIKIWYKRKPADWNALTSPLDQLFDPCIIMRAAMIGFETVRDFDESAKEEKMFERYVVQKKLPLDSVKLNDYRQGWKVRLK